MIVDGIGLIGSNKNQTQQPNDTNSSQPPTEEPQENTVQPTEESDTSTDAGRDDTASTGNTPSRADNESSQSSGAGSAQGTSSADRAPAETVVSAQITPPETSDDLESLARANAERAQVEARTQALIDSIATVEPKAPVQSEVQSTKDTQESLPGDAAPVDTYA
jgi:hypothetical protein